MTDLDRVSKAIREEIVRQYRDNDRVKCPAGVPFWEEEVQPMLLAEVAIRAYQQYQRKRHDALKTGP